MSSPSKRDAMNNTVRLENTPFTPHSLLPPSSPSKSLNFSQVKSQTQSQSQQSQSQSQTLSPSNSLPPYDPTAISLLIDDNQSIGQDSSTQFSPNSPQSPGGLPPQSKSLGFNQSQMSFLRNSSSKLSNVTTTDVNLSARSFSEKMLVGIRDGSIQVGQEQVSERKYENTRDESREMATDII